MPRESAGADIATGALADGRRAHGLAGWVRSPVFAQDPGQSPPPGQQTEHPELPTPQSPEQNRPGQDPECPYASSPSRCTDLRQRTRRFPCRWGSRNTTTRMHRDLSKSDRSLRAVPIPGVRHCEFAAHRPTDSRRQAGDHAARCGGTGAGKQHGHRRRALQSMVLQTPIFWRRESAALPHGGHRRGDFLLDGQRSVHSITIPPDSTSILSMMIAHAGE